MGESWKKGSPLLVGGFSMGYVLVGFCCFMVGGFVATLVLAMVALHEDDKYPLDDIGTEEDKGE